MNTKPSNDLVSISIDVLDRVTGGIATAARGSTPGSGSGKKPDPTSQPGITPRGLPTVEIDKYLAELTDAIQSAGSRKPTGGAMVHNGGGNSDYYY